MDITEFYQTFFEEAEELLNEMEHLLLDIDIDEPDSEQLNAIFRAAHSIKGGAGTFGFTVLQETTHIFENLLDRARHNELTLDREIIDIFLETKDMLTDQLNAYRNQEEPDPEAFERICNTLKRIAEERVEGGAPKVAAPKPAAQPAAGADAAARVLTLTLTKIEEDEKDTLTEELALFGAIKHSEFSEGTLTVSIETQEPVDDIEAVLCFVLDAGQISIKETSGAEASEPVQSAPAPVAEQPSASAAQPAAKKPEDDKKATAKPAAPKKPAKAGNGSDASLRVSTEKVDQIINLVGELVITQSMLEQTTQGLDPVAYGQLLNGMTQLQRNARDLQEAVMSVRMMPMDYVFNRFPRLVRDLAGKLGKEIELVTVGKSTELDKGLIERIIDPLTHLVRNCLDHGIELPDKREAAGKHRVGKLTLSAQHQGGNILIEVSDDGAGLNREKILSKAQSSGIQISDTMSDEDVWQLIFAPGFSTADEITDVSGRGVGMDVVKRNIQQMGGHVDILSQAGKGSTTRIVLPLTLAILDGMSVKVGDEVFILPLGAIMESIQVKTEEINKVAGQDQVIYVRGEYLPLVELHKVFNVPSAQTDVTQGIVMIVQSEGRHCALLVDQLIGQHQVVVKNLETNYRKVPGISAATIMGDGSVALILDVPALQRISRDRRGESSRSSATVH
ncbi:chemotaxis protein CheA [Larsenimonas suaedae]|uniref:Chemotaxis protein CheA n=1 Tax=Larsenimonas suaedae TaxID=1851019 RepID=A0ABU1GT87_9GAMM|nr:chemotaxis protein CheA [Larsenimonas suaedae]MCM2971642.1 chemotaxis protein CheA [Larsenimonas suaedae]MDR5895194.1 chemotaxis protein CheA [Larsenimonas suaedae]